ncbi:hypothetical protein [Allorhizocola rhizosphaerae]|uniref:hypothetical protein n=1 Tax=Allorhizocola rhizosphaerae TaxID=1872709 RepID=UPI000E3CCD90|nr:hypothetical protein [Allorhizocola rhizosphaerae]
MPQFDLTTFRDTFRDEAQRNRVMWVLHDRLADDRQQLECRYLLKLASQLYTDLTEVTLDQLQRHLGPAKFQAVQDLIEAAAGSPEQIDGWIIRTEAAFPVVEDRGYAAHGKRLRRLWVKGRLRAAWRFVWHGK